MSQSEPLEAETPAEYLEAVKSAFDRQEELETEQGRQFEAIHVRHEFGARRVFIIAALLVLAMASLVIGHCPVCQYGVRPARTV